MKITGGGGETVRKRRRETLRKKGVHLTVNGQGRCGEGGGLGRH